MRQLVSSQIESFLDNLIASKNISHFLVARMNKNLSGNLSFNFWYGFVVSDQMVETENIAEYLVYLFYFLFVPFIKHYVVVQISFYLFFEWF